jgi:hypothetical protein
MSDQQTVKSAKPWPSTKRRKGMEDAIGAIRLALEGAADDATAVAVIRDIVRRAPKTYAGDVGPARELLAAIRRTKVRVRVPQASTRGDQRE